MDKEKKEIKAYAKKVGQKLVAIGSSETPDRGGDSVKASGWITENFLKNPVIPFAHNYSEPPVGIAKNVRVEGKNLVFEPVFHEFTQLAREVKAMYEADPPIMRAFSVGFIPLEGKEGKDAYDITKQELLEISAVPVPANAEALTIAAKSYTKQDKAKVCEWINGQLQCSFKGVASEVKPYPNEHSCRLVSPDKFEADSFKSVEREHNEKKYRVIMGKLKGEDTMTEQGYRYHKDTWSTASAESHCESHDGIKFEPASGEKAEEETYKCECLDCGHTMETEEHCKDLKCTECGGEMRRVDRPGVGKEVEELKKEDPVMKDAKVGKTRWNKSLSKAFDIEAVESVPATFELDLFTKFFDCPVKEIYQNDFLIPCPLLGTYLAGFKALTTDFELVDTRNFSYNGTEIPLIFEVIKLNSEKSEDFLIEGTQFYKVGGKDKFIMQISPTWYGLNISLVTSTEDRKWNKEFLEKVQDWVTENNFLRGEKFALNGEFLEKTKDNWNSLVLDKKIEKTVTRTVSILDKKKTDLASRGMMFVGEPGTGKTKTGRVLMNDVESTFIWVSSKDFREVGALRALSLAFQLARDLSPTILFIEDIDTWLRESAIDLLKTELDGLKQNKGIITILTSNTPEQLPVALLDRPGRFHDVLDFKLPDRDIREEMLKRWVSEDIDIKLLEDILEKTSGFSGAHIKELIDFAKIIAEEEEKEIGDALLMSLEKILEQRKLIEQIKEKEKKVKMLELKETQVLSDKDRESINSAVSILKQAASTLQDLPVKAKYAKGGEGGPSKSRLEVAQEPLKNNRVVVRALQRISGDLGQVLNKIKK